MGDAPIQSSSCTCDQAHACIRPARLLGCDQQGSILGLRLDQGVDVIERKVEAIAVFGIKLCVEDLLPFAEKMVAVHVGDLGAALVVAVAAIVDARLRLIVGDAEVVRATRQGIGVAEVIIVALVKECLPIFKCALIGLQFIKAHAIASLELIPIQDKAAYGLWHAAIDAEQAPFRRISMRVDRLFGGWLRGRFDGILGIPDRQNRAEQEEGDQGGGGAFHRIESLQWPEYTSIVDLFKRDVPPPNGNFIAQTQLWKG